MCGRTEPLGTEIECSQCGKKYKKHQKQGRRCKECLKLNRRRHYTATRGASWKKYEKTKKGFLMRVYRNMKSRVEGIQKKKFHLYMGLELLSKKEFYKWSLDNPDFHELFDAWEKEQYNRRLSPSIDRIDPRQGYHILNMQWVTHSENSSRASIYRHYGKII